MKFHTTIERGGKTATGIRVPDEVVEALGSGKRPAVRVTINNFTYRSTIAVTARGSCPLGRKPQSYVLDQPAAVGSPHRAAGSWRVLLRTDSDVRRVRPDQRASPERLVG